MMDVSGFPKKKMITAKPMIFRKKKEIITWKEDILHLVTWFPGMWLPGLQKKDVMRVMV